MIHCLQRLQPLGMKKWMASFSRTWLQRSKKLGGLPSALFSGSGKFLGKKDRHSACTWWPTRHIITNICKITSAGKIALLDIKRSPVVLWCFLQYASICTTWSQPVLGKQNVKNLKCVKDFFWGFDISWLQLRSQTQNPTELLFLWPLPRDVSRQQPARMYDFQWIASGHEQPKLSCSIMLH